MAKLDCHNNRTLMPHTSDINNVQQRILQLLQTNTIGISDVQVERESANDQCKKTRSDLIRAKPALSACDVITRTPVGGAYRKRFSSRKIPSDTLPKHKYFNRQESLIASKKKCETEDRSENEGWHPMPDITGTWTMPKP